MIIRTSLVFALGILAWPAIALARGSMTFTVVSEQTRAGAIVDAPTPDHPVACVVRDGGVVEGGDLIAGEKPPAPDAVARALGQALASTGYRAVSTGDAPSLLLTYHWGLIRPVTVAGARGRPQGPQLTYDRTLRARIALVAPSALAHDTQDYYIGINHIPTGIYATPAMLDAIQSAMDSHYFIIVSAYDYAAATRGEAVLLWRTRLSTIDNAGDQDRVIVTLAAASGPYLGRTFRSARREETPLLREAPASAELPTAAPAGESDATRTWIGKLLAREHATFSGDLGADEERFDAAPAVRPAVPAGLARRVAAYQRDKAALQAELAERIKGRTPGPDTAAALDAFNRENAGRIAALARTREALRDELARAAAAAGRGDKTLDALRREFADDARDLNAPAARQP